MKGLSKYITHPFQLMALEGGISIQALLLEMRLPAEPAIWALPLETEKMPQPQSQTLCLYFLVIHLHIQAQIPSCLD